MTTTTQITIPKVCTWTTFYNHAIRNGLFDVSHPDFVMGYDLQRIVEAQAEREGFKLWVWNSTGRRGNAQGTQVWNRMQRDFWIEFAKRAGIPVNSDFTV